MLSSLPNDELVNSEVLNTVQYMFAQCKSQIKKLSQDKDILENFDSAKIGRIINFHSEQIGDIDIYKSKHQQLQINALTVEQKEIYEKIETYLTELANLNQQILLLAKNFKIYPE